MFRGGLGVQELVIILVIVLLLFGPKQLPKLSRMFGKAMKDVKDGLEGKVEETDQLPAGESESETAEAAKKAEDKTPV